MINQVVVYVSDQDREGDPPPEFFDICTGSPRSLERYPNV
ncbi:hypothetical protein GGQ85_004009 [Nitrobacter vulgaris]|nr:hypothetical protein [Nitrobacter vulgaris]